MRPARLDPLLPRPDLDIRLRAGAPMFDQSAVTVHPAMAIVPKHWRRPALESAEGIGAASRNIREALPGQSIAGGLPNGGISVLVRAPLTDGLSKGMGLSALVHLALALATAVLLPSTMRPMNERGGTPTAIEVVLVGDSEANATTEGGHPPEVDIATRVVLPAEARIQPTIEAAVPAPDAPAGLTIPAELLVPLPYLSLPASPPDLLAPPRAAEPPQRPHAPKPRTSAMRRAKKAPEKSEAHAGRRRAAPGQRGEGPSAVSARATERGGSGGRGPVAGNAAVSNYRSRVVAHLTRYKTYPEQAQDRGVTGRNTVTITLDRAGRVTGSGLSAGSGHSILDAATLAAVRRAQPFPPIPDGGPTSFTVTISLRYDLR